MLTKFYHSKCAFVEFIPDIFTIYIEGFVSKFANDSIKLGIANVKEIENYKSRNRKLFLIPLSLK